jgi:hypothetical protein
MHISLFPEHRLTAVRHVAALAVLRKLGRQLQVLQQCEEETRQVGALEHGAHACMHV